MNKKEDNNHKFSFKNINKRLFITILLLVITITSGTLSWFAYRSDKSTLVLKVRDISDVRVILKPYEIVSSIDPSDTYEDGEYTQIDAINGGKYDVNVELFYEINQLSDVLIDNGLRYTIVSSNEKDGVYTEVTTGDFTGIIDNRLEILNLEVPANTTNYYRVYVWLLNDLDQTIIQGEELNIKLNGKINYDEKEINDIRYTCNSDNSISIYNISTCIGNVCNYTKVDNSSVTDQVIIESSDALKSDLTVLSVANNCGDEYVTELIDDDTVDFGGFFCLDSDISCMQPMVMFSDSNIFNLVRIANVSWNQSNELWHLVRFENLGFHEVYNEGLTGLTNVQITGTNKAKSVLTANVNDMQSENTYSYQWYVNNTNSTSGGTKLEGETNSTLTLTEDYVGKYIYVVVTSVTPNLGTITYTDITDETIATNLVAINAERYTCDNETIRVPGEVRDGVAQNITLKTISIYDITTCDGTTCSYNKKNSNSSITGTITVDSLDALKSGLTYDSVKANCGDEYVIRHYALTEWFDFPYVNYPYSGEMIFNAGEYMELSPITGHPNWYRDLGNYYSSYFNEVLIIDYKNTYMYDCNTANNSIDIYYINRCDDFACEYNEKNGREIFGDDVMLSQLNVGLDPDSVKANCGDSFVTNYTFAEDTTVIGGDYVGITGGNGGDIFNAGETLEVVKINGYDNWYWFNDFEQYYYLP